jgi:hypothetical protein
MISESFHQGKLALSFEYVHEWESINIPSMSFFVLVIANAVTRYERPAFATATTKNDIDVQVCPSLSAGEVLRNEATQHSPEALVMVLIE